MTGSFSSFVLSLNVRSCSPPQHPLRPSGHFTIQSQKYPQEIRANSPGWGPDPGDGAVGTWPWPSPRLPLSLSPANRDGSGHERPAQARPGTHRNQAWWAVGEGGRVHRVERGSLRRAMAQREAPAAPQPTSSRCGHLRSG